MNPTILKPVHKTDRARVEESTEARVESTVEVDAPPLQKILDPGTQGESFVVLTPGTIPQK
jgi:hypothetical protein